MKDIPIPGTGKKIPPAVVAMIFILIGAGATAGAAAGTIEGEGNTEVEQALVIGTEGIFIDNEDGGIAQVGDSNTSFVTSATIQQGEDYEIEINLTNEADEEVLGQVVIEGAAPLHIDASGDSDIDVQQAGDGEFLISADKNTDNDRLILSVSSDQDINPGFFEFEVIIKPVDVNDEVRSDQ
jgi:hypothetical protein